MSFRISTTRSTGTYSDNIQKLREALDTAEAVVIGAGAGLSTSAGFVYTGERFERYFSDFAAKYGFRDMYSGGFYPFPAPEEFWAYWSRYIYINRYLDPPKPVYDDLLELVRDRALRRSGCSTPRATTGCSSVRSPAAGRPSTMRGPSGRWWSSSGICASPPGCCPSVPTAEGP